jgi:hypothetical protein
VTGFGYPADAARLFYGENARHVPAFLYVQDASPGVVSFVGSSMTPGENPHPLRYGAPHYRAAGGARRDDYWPHHLIVGEIIVRPHVVVATRALSGFGLGQMFTSAPSLEDLIEGGAGRLVVGDSARLADVIHRSRTAAWRGR